MLRASDYIFISQLIHNFVLDVFLFKEILIEYIVWFYKQLTHNNQRSIWKNIENTYFLYKSLQSLSNLGRWESISTSTGAEGVFEKYHIHQKSAYIWNIQNFNLYK